MSKADPFVIYRDVLALRGMRVTPQRLMILQVIDEGHGHLTAEEIGERIRARFPSIHQGTIYRTLEVLREAGLVTETHLGDRSAVYELIGSHPHHHLVCERCGQVTEIGDTLLEPLRAALLAQFGFHARTEHFALFGLCAECAAQEQNRMR
jgi:Fur family ferric uptake transcriptional regulator